MIAFERFELANGLRVLIHEDPDTPMAAVNVLYDVGSRDEDPEQTGFAHLFEHLMFGGSKNVPNFDEPLQRAGGENNAFTNSDYTNFYDILPAQNLETALWLESDRMLSLEFEETALDIERKIVVEEFMETCLNQPYGDSWHHLSALAYAVHPYRWPTIGLHPDHIASATMDSVKRFYFEHYRPNNAILTIAGNVKTAKVRKLVEKWFDDIPSGPVPPRQLPLEPPQTAFRQRVIESPVPMDALYLSFHMVARDHPDFYVADLISDLLANGTSARLFRRLLKERQLFSAIDCYLSGTMDAGLLIIEGKPAPGVSLEQALEAIWQELNDLKTNLLSPYELQKCKNKTESFLVFSELNITSKAQNLGFFELMGDPHLINTEAALYTKITAEAVQRVAQEIFHSDRCCQLLYHSVGS